MTTAFVWGYNNSGELGLPHAMRVFRPTPAKLVDGLVDLQGGAAFSVALTSSGEVWCWGGNAYGQLGDGTRWPRRVPKRVVLPQGAKAAGIAAGTDHVLVVTTKGRVVAWGRNHRGQLGMGHVNDELSPRIVELETVKSVAAGDAISAAVTPTGGLVTWGRNGSNQLGQASGLPGLDALRPAKASSLAERVSAVDAGLRHLVVLTSDGQVHAFGVDARSRPLTQRVPIRLAWGRVRAISAGDDHILALTSNGTVLCWGANALGQLGVGDDRPRLSPVVVGLPNARGRAVKIRAGHRHSLVLTDQNEVYAWGEGRYGALGLGNPDRADTRTLRPALVDGLQGMKPLSLAGGGYSSAVLVSRGPAIGLTVTPTVSMVKAGQPVSFAVRTVDVFGHDLGAPAGRLKAIVPAFHFGQPTSTATARGVSVLRATASSTLIVARDPGTYTVTITAGTLTGTATLHVRKA